MGVSSKPQDITRASKIQGCPHKRARARRAAINLGQLYLDQSKIGMMPSPSPRGLANHADVPPSTPTWPSHSGKGDKQAAAVEYRRAVESATTPGTLRVRRSLARIGNKPKAATELKAASSRRAQHALLASIGRLLGRQARMRWNRRSTRPSRPATIRARVRRGVCRHSMTNQGRRRTTRPP
jgi:hypothetical protein